MAGSAGEITVSSERPITPVRASLTRDVVLDQLRQALQLGRFLPGAKLPPERSLARQLGVSRMTVRAAAGRLVREGLLEVRRGAHGGLFVRRGRIAGATASRFTAEQLDNAFLFRIATERAAARLAATRRRSVDCRRLGKLVAEMSKIVASKAARSDPDQVARFLALDVEFHLGVAAAARNPLLLDAIERALAERFLPLGRVFGALHPDANDGHAEILAAVDQQRPEQAERAMTAHIERTWRGAARLLANPKAGG